MYEQLQAPIVAIRFSCRREQQIRSSAQLTFADRQFLEWKVIVT